MPTYQYRCPECGYTFEVFQSMSDKPLRYTTDCPLGKRRCRVERVIGAGAGFIFKGSGFYATDYRSKEYREKAKKETQSVDASTKESGSKESSSKAKSPKKTDN